MKKIGFYLAHPAHFHLFKNVIENLVKKRFLKYWLFTMKKMFCMN